MRAGIILFNKVDGLIHGRVFKKSAVINRFRNIQRVLFYHATRPNIKMPSFAIPLLAFKEAHRETTSRKLRMGIFFEPSKIIWGCFLVYGVTRIVKFSNSPAI